MSGDSADDVPAVPPNGRPEGVETQVTRLSTMHGGKAASIVDSDDQARAGAGRDRADGSAGDESGDLARAALAGAQGLGRAAGRKPGRRPGRGGEKAEAGSAAARGGYSGPDADENDPQLVGSVLAGYVSDRGWERPLASARVFTDWAELVGAEVAAHCRPASLTAGELKVEAESTAWATQLRLLGGTVLARLVAQLGPDVVTKVQFRGPTAPSWKHGGLSVRGSRGPRDTYG